MITTILLMTSIVFLSRYLFLEPKLPFSVSPKLRQFLTFSSPAVLTAIWAPIVFMPENQLDVSFTNPFLIAAGFAVVLAKATKNVLLTTIVSMAIFLFLHHYM